MSTPDQNQSKVNIPAIVGAVVGVILLIVLALAIFLCFKLRSHDDSAGKEDVERQTFGNPVMEQPITESPVKEMTRIQETQADSNAFGPYDKRVQEDAEKGNLREEEYQASLNDNNYTNPHGRTSGDGQYLNDDRDMHQTPPPLMGGRTPEMRLNSAPFTPQEYDYAAVGYKGETHPGESYPGRLHPLAADSRRSRSSMYPPEDGAPNYRQSRTSLYPEDGGVTGGYSGGGMSPVDEGSPGLSPNRAVQSNENRRTAWPGQFQAPQKERERCLTDKSRVPAVPAETFRADQPGSPEFQYESDQERGLAPPQNRDYQKNRETMGPEQTYEVLRGMNPFEDEKLPPLPR